MEKEDNASLVSQVERAQNLLKNVPLIDGHNDFPYIIRGWYRNQLGARRTDVHRMPIGQTDLQRLNKSGLGAQFWSAFVPCAKEISQLARLQVLEMTLEQIDTIHQLVHLHPDQLGFATSEADVWDHFRAGRIASLIGVEGLHQIAGSASILRIFHRLGVRYVTLCHDCSNEYVDSATSLEPLYNGISEPGKDMLLEMNRIGMIIDLSHTSADVQRRVLQLSKAPVMFSHSSVYTLCENARNVPDDVLDQLKDNGGICMVCFLPDLCKSNLRTDEPPSAASIVDHIQYIGERIGYEHVGVGSDFDGMLRGPQGMDDVTCYPLLVAEMLHRGIDETQIKHVIGLNVLRVLREVQHKAFELQNDPNILPLIDEIESPWTEAQKGMLRQEGEKRGLSAVGGDGKAENGETKYVPE